MSFSGHTPDYHTGSLYTPVLWKLTQYKRSLTAELPFTCVIPKNTFDSVRCDPGHRNNPGCQKIPGVKLTRVTDK